MTRSARRRVDEGQLGGVQERAGQSEHRAPLAVGRVADERMTDRGEVDPDLVRPAGLEPAFEPRHDGRRRIATR